MADTSKRRSDWTPGRLATLRLGLSGGIGPCRYAQLLDKFRNPEAALAGLIAMRRKDIAVATPADAAAAIKAAAQVGAGIVVRGDGDYPKSLAATARPPIFLYYSGALDRLDMRLVAIVGARNASLAARKFAEALAADLSAAGVGVVSGLARGIDGAAHRGSLEGFPIGVVAGGIDVTYPREHAKLQADIADRGVLLAESPVGAQPTERHFPRRNRIVAGLAAAVVVIEAAERSGSLITARFAMEEGRDVMAAPGFPTDPRAAGANRLIREGAVLIRSADDVLAELGAATAAAIPRARPAPAKIIGARPSADLGDLPFPEADDAPADPIEIVRAALAVAPVTVDELTRECQLSASVVAAVLQELELGGVLERLPGQRVTLR